MSKQIDSLRVYLDTNFDLLMQAIKSQLETPENRTYERNYAIQLPDLPLRDADSVTQLNADLNDPVYAEQMVRFC